MFIIRDTIDLEQSKRIYKFLKNIDCRYNGGGKDDWQYRLDVNDRFAYTIIIYNKSEKDYYPGCMLPDDCGANWYLWYTNIPERVLKQKGASMDQWVELDFSNSSDKLFILNKEGLC